MEEGVRSLTQDTVRKADEVKSDCAIKVSRHSHINYSESIAPVPKVHVEECISSDGKAEAKTIEHEPRNDGAEKLLVLAENAATNEVRSLAIHKERHAVPFPLKLMEVVSNESHSDIISWLSHGRGFMIYKTKEFVDNVMPKYFKQTKFPSFTRKLSRWGFHRVQRGPEVGVYYHDLFKRDAPRLCLQIRCLPNRLEKPPQHNVQEILSRTGNPLEINNIPSRTTHPVLPKRMNRMDLLNLNLEYERRTDQLDDNLLEMLLRKRQKKMLRRNVAGLPDDFLRNNYSPIMSGATNENYLQSLAMMPSAQYAPMNNVGNMIPGHTRLNEIQALQASLGLSNVPQDIVSNEIKNNLLGILRNRGVSDMISRRTGIPSQSPLGLPPGRNIALEVALRDMGLADYLL